MDAPTFCYSCGGTALEHFKDREFTIEYRDFKETVTGIEGWQCLNPDCDDTIFEMASEKIYAAASDRCVAYRRELAKQGADKC
ncbi:hypothetical protein ACYPKM_04820 [Pseudomonas aeruginosa]